MPVAFAAEHFLRRGLPAALVLGAAAFAAAGEASPHDWVPELDAAPVELHGARAILWSASFGTENADWVNDVVPAGAGFVATGFVNRAETGAAEWDAFAHGFSAQGRRLWTKRYGGPGLDAAWSAVPAQDGGLALAGFSAAGGAGGTDQWLLLLDASAEPRAERRFGGVKDERATDLVPAADGGYLLVGQTESFGAGERDVFLVRTDAAGVERWSRSFGGPGVDRGFYGVATPDGGFVVAGVTGRQGDYDLLVLKLDAEGHEQWRRVIGGSGNDANHGINLLPDGRVVVVGYTSSWGASEHDLVAVTLSPDGAVLRAELLGGPGDDRVMGSYTAADGGTWLVGYTTSFGAGGWDVLIARLTPEGRFEPWLGAIGTPHADHGTTLAEAPDGSLVVGGYSDALSGGARPADLLLFAVEPEAIERLEGGVVVRPLPEP